MSPQPVIDDPTLGRLKRTRLVEGCRDEYEGSVKLGGDDVGVALYSDDKRDPAPTLAHAREIVGRLPAFVEAAKRFAAEEHVKAYNEIWRLEGDKELTTDAFLEASRLTNLYMDADGKATLWFDVGDDLFGGHFVEVRTDPAGKFVSTDLLG